jgi:broad specificity phosphatase PhoE
MECLSEIASTHAGGRVLVVMHTTLKRLLLCRLIGAPLRDYRRLFPSVRNCAMTQLRLDGDVTSVIEFNAPLDPTTAPIIKPSAQRAPGKAS